jgi:outer membrane lipoprotein-sorting protein
MNPSSGAGFQSVQTQSLARIRITPARAGALCTLPVLACLMIAATQTTYAQSLKDVFSAMDATASKFKGLQANMRDDDFTALVNDHSVQNGTIRVKKSAQSTLMLIQFTGPNAKMISLDANTVKILNPKTKVEQVYDIGNKRDLIDQYLLLGFGASSEDLTKAYTISWIGSESIAGQNTGHIQLVPKSAEQLHHLRQVDLWISTSIGVPVQQKFLTGGGGDYKLVTYTNLKLNPSLSDKDLQLKEPRDVQIEHVQH